MTREELYNNYQFKVSKRIIMNEFPFVKDIVVMDEEFINKYKHNLYVDLIIDPYLMADMYGFTVWPAVIRTHKRGEPYWSTGLSIFLDDEDRIELAHPIRRRIEQIFDSVADSEALPNELKLDGKSIHPASYWAYPDTLPSKYKTEDSSDKDTDS